MKALITGANGQLGRALADRFPDAEALTRQQLDISDAAAVAAYDWSGVDTIFNAAAYTNVDGAETADGRMAAWAANAQAVANLAGAALRHDLRLVHVSTDYVFDGRRPVHDETEPVSPLGVYGQSKAAGELATLLVRRCYLVRVSWLIGNGPNFVRTMMRHIGRTAPLNVVDDQLGRLTFTAQLVDAIEHLVTTRAPYGIYHVSNDGPVTSWEGVTRAIAAAIGRTDAGIAGVSTAEYFADKPGAAPRPLHSAFNLDKIKGTGLQLRDWRSDLRDYIAQERNKEG